MDVFTRKEYRDIFLDIAFAIVSSIKGLEVIAYCVMNSHILMIISRHGNPNLEQIIRDIKKFTSTKIIEAIQNNPQESRRELFLWLFEKAGRRNSNNKNFQFWQQNIQPIELTTDKFIYQKLNYIRNNPVEAGIVLTPEDYFYSSAANCR